MKFRFYASCLFCFSTAVLFGQKEKTDVSNTKDGLALSLDTLNVPSYQSEKMDTLKVGIKNKADTLQVKYNDGCQGIESTYYYPCF